MSSIYKYGLGNAKDDGLISCFDFIIASSNLEQAELYFNQMSWSVVLSMLNKIHAAYMPYAETGDQSSGYFSAGTSIRRQGGISNLKQLYQNSAWDIVERIFKKCSAKEKYDLHVKEAQRSYMPLSWMLRSLCCDEKDSPGKAKEILECFFSGLTLIQRVELIKADIAQSTISGFCSSLCERLGKEKGGDAAWMMFKGIKSEQFVTYLTRAAGSESDYQDQHMVLILISRHDKKLFNHIMGALPILDLDWDFISTRVHLRFWLKDNQEDNVALKWQLQQNYKKDLQRLPQEQLSFFQCPFTIKKVAQFYASIGDNAHDELALSAVPVADDSSSVNKTMSKP